MMNSTLEDALETCPEGQRERTRGSGTLCDEPMQIILWDMDANMVRAWEREFAVTPGVEICRNQVYNLRVDAYVTAVYLNEFSGKGADVESVLMPRGPRQDRLSQAEKVLAVEHRQPGIATILRVADDPALYAVSVPIPARAPEHSEDQRVYEAAWVALDALKEYGEEHPEAIRSLAIPALCLGRGMVPETIARQMHRAIREVLKR